MRQGRVPSKHGNQQYYKGTGGGSMGEFVKTRFVLNPNKIRCYVVPDLKGCELKPYVAQTTRPEASAKCIKTTQDYLDRCFNLNQ